MHSFIKTSETHLVGIYFSVLPFDMYDEQTHAKIIDLALTLTLVDRGLVRVVQSPFPSSVYGLPTGKALERLSARYKFMLVILTNQPFGKNNQLLKPLDEFVTRGTDLEAFNNVDAVKRTMQTSPFFFAGNEEHGVYFSEVPFNTVMKDAKGKAILDRAQSWRSEVAAQQ